ncbi:metal-sensitive transcriptional regulator [Desulforamulus hydrothermalis]|uniref:Uncharacterized protein n=1 Tax=Desulforamulus hydrothermalis Lam5 = DSM 18033 TaxID=1121428 RepID=K8EDQ8_9FIRM|nr:metal-sensitive transcriptional regulator [Desulforamulus hydrothermalis]CCO06936.1 conserved hypothetical protein [Desulforamulus hydrothermalis Lam5 = DSM 18033]SHG99152.1 DNA-binding transcriptional regulator, FrmR family [Desulforamulus hydrothermalis Lam5 = DSM 18033]
MPKNIDPEIQQDLLTRLKKIEGQVRGIQKMIGENRSCSDIVTQLAAVKAAVNRVGFSVLACYLAGSLKDNLEQGKEITESMDDFMKIFKKFS